MVPVQRPRATLTGGGELGLDSYAVFSSTDLLTQVAMERMLAGVAARITGSPDIPSLDAAVRAEVAARVQAGTPLHVAVTPCAYHACSVTEGALAGVARLEDLAARCCVCARGRDRPPTRPRMHAAASAPRAAAHYFPRLGEQRGPDVENDSVARFEGREARWL
jgi:hypothetical protein